MSTIDLIRKNLNSVILGKSEVIDKVIAGLLASGHILLEDVPGTGKTTLAKAVALSFNMDFKRIQFTPDVLPSDITGITVYDLDKKSFNVRFGPIFTNILLADEINRATPKAQSALLEAMAEYSVTIDGVRHNIEKPFIVFATQNPIEYEGTFPLPEAQLDRFLMKFSIGYPDKEFEKQILNVEKVHDPLEEIKVVATREDLLKLQEETRRVYVHPKLVDYLVDLSNATRSHRDVYLGLSPRATIHLMKVSQAYAKIDGRAFVIPDDIKLAFPDVVNHRLILKADAKLRGKRVTDVIEDILKSTKVPTDIDFKNEVS
ncbi:AAA family ATPase [Caldisericum exile]|uniref:ATPase n=1 Tax=Caldisericum exile (strain DSM 21853 / NBRC 104410 / AZM16c01) TaxID=511051 RepID=A0A7U6GEG7_CALEA|nr:MoxR family ATPase [Caldisericum exile]BAL80903.1 putative ATPase [Caldisericum exile AZM16c01]